MRAAVVEAFGPFDAIKVKEIETPLPAPGEILIRVSVAGVNFADGGMVSGRTPRKQPPFVPGVEAAGTVEAIGKSVTDHCVGDRVVYWDPLPRAFAELVAVAAWRAVPIPAGVPDEVAVTLMVQGTTAHYLTTDSFKVGPGHTCLIHAAAGGVGQLLVQIAALRGARAIAIVGGEAPDSATAHAAASIVGLSPCATGANGRAAGFRGRPPTRHRRDRHRAVRRLRREVPGRCGGASRARAAPTRR
jgi:NADPH2:quinone reductase